VTEPDEFSEPMTAGVDIGGTKIALALVDGDGRIHDFYRRSTQPEQGHERMYEHISELLDRCKSDCHVPVRSLGIGIAGLVDRTQGILRSSPNLRWEDVSVVDELEERLGIPVAVANDVDAASWGEFLHGAGSDVDDLVCVFVGTGVGAGAISGEQLLDGCVASAMELGHITIVQDGRECTCPNTGCLEAYAGGWAIGERTRDAVRKQADRTNKLVELAGGNVDDISAKHLAERYRKGGSLAKQLVEETGQYLASGLINIITLLNPQALVLGGGVIEGIPDLRNMVRPEIDRRCFPTYSESVEIRKPKLDERSPVIGAAALAREQIR